MELGYDGKINDNTETMDFEFEDFAGNNTFGYNRAIHGFFFEYDYKLNKKISIKPSMRYEYVSKDISFKSTQINNGTSDIIYVILLIQSGLPLMIPFGLKHILQQIIIFIPISILPII